MPEESRQIRTVELEKEFAVCPGCGYDKGFHNMFRKAVENGHLKWFLICPQCGATYDIGLTFTRK